MNDRSRRRYDKCKRAFNFATANASDVATTDAPQHITKLGNIIKGLDKSKASQAHGSAEPREVLIDALRLDMQDITRMARAIGQETVGFEKLFRAPASDTPSVILTTADTFIGNLIPTPTNDPATQAAKTDRQAKFVAHGFVPDFAATLQMHRSQIEDTEVAEDNADSKGEENTAAIGRLIAAGMIECNYLDAIFHVVYRSNRDKLAAWICENHLERAPQKAKTTTKTASTQPAATSPAP